MKVYMIYDPSTGLYSTGGQRPRFVEQTKAKVWRCLGHVRSAISNARYGRTINTSDWKVIQFDLTNPVDLGIWK